RIWIGGRVEGGTDDFVAGNAGPADLEGAGGGRAARFGCVAADSADYEWNVCGEARFVVSGAASDGRGRLDFGILGRFGKQPAREVLPADEARAEAARGRNETLGPDCVGDWASARNGVAGGSDAVLCEGAKSVEESVSGSAGRGRARRRGPGASGDAGGG